MINFKGWFAFTSEIYAIFFGDHEGITTENLDLGCCMFAVRHKPFFTIKSKITCEYVGI